MASNNETFIQDHLTTEDSPPRYESAVRYATGRAGMPVGNHGDGAAASDRQMSLNELARKHRQMARRERRRGNQGPPPSGDAVSGDSESGKHVTVTMDTNKHVSDVTRINDVTDYPDVRVCERVPPLPRIPVPERLFFITGSKADSSNTEKNTENVSFFQNNSPNVEKVSSEVIPERYNYTNEAYDFQSSLPNQKNDRKQIRWKEAGTKKGESCDLDDVFTVSDVSGIGGVGDKVSISVVQTQAGDGGSSVNGTKSCDLTTSTEPCDTTSDNVNPVTQENKEIKQRIKTHDKSGSENEQISNIMQNPRSVATSSNRKIPKLERQAAFSAADYSSSSDSELTDNNKNLGQGHQGHAKVTQDEDEDVYVPLWGIGKKVSTTVQYKNDDTYVPIWTNNVTKNKREIRISRSMDDMLEGDLQMQGQRSPRVPKTVSLDIGANKTTRVILKDNLPQRTTAGSDQGHSRGQSQLQGQVNEGQGQYRGQIYEPKSQFQDQFNGQHQVQVNGLSDNHESHKTSNGRRLSKLKLVNGDLDIPQVHIEAAANVKAASPRSNEGHIFGLGTVNTQVPSLLERRGILLREASSEDRAPSLPVKYGRNLRSYDQLGRSLERSKSLQSSRSFSTKLPNGASYEQNRTTYVSPGGNKNTPRDSTRSQSTGPLQKLKRHLSRSKSYSLEAADTSAPPTPPSEDTTSRRHKNYFDLAIFTSCCCLSPLGLVAVVFSVLSDRWWVEGEERRAHTYSRAALILCILGIISTVSLWSALLATNSLPFIKHVDVGEPGHQFSS